MSASGHQPFSTTRWSLVLEAGRAAQGEPDLALDELCRSYWMPLYAFARRRGYSANDAADVTQEFFAKLIEKSLLQTADPARGRFRNFLLTVFQRFLVSEYTQRNTIRAGGRVRLLPLNIEDGEQTYSVLSLQQESPEQVFERQWALSLLSRVLDVLQSEHTARGKEALYRTCQPLLVGLSAEHRYDEIAQQLGMTAGAVRVAVHRMRERYREILRQEVAKTVESDDEVEDEIRHLRAVLGAQG